ncbi:adenylyl-sulfate kinase [Crossiella sp. NPDC003009]
MAPRRLWQSIVDGLAAMAPPYYWPPVPGDYGRAAFPAAGPARESAGPGITVLLTGLPSAGKSTIARGVADRLRAAGWPVAVLDGDEVRAHLTRDLGFSRADREENIRRIGWVALLLATHGIATLVPVIAPYRTSRARLRDQHRHGGADFAEIHVATPLEVCRARDVKGLYAQQRAGRLRGLTGVDDPYEPPEAAELVLPAHRQSVSESVQAVCELVVHRSWV